jgi:thymidylate synthase (FAD)
MKLINSDVEIWKQGYTLEEIYKHIEKCGRVCYKSEDKITDDSYIKFCDMLKRSGHLSVFEHGTVYLKIDVVAFVYEFIVNQFIKNKYSKVNMSPDGRIAYITTNMRVILENDWEHYLGYMHEPSPEHKRRITAHFNCSIGTSREFNRHRVNSISEQSTRYCNYSKNKFGNQLTFTIPTFLEDRIAPINRYIHIPDVIEDTIIDEYLCNLSNAEKSYFNLIALGCKPQEAREALPLSTATELVHTAFESDWNHFIELRTASGAHPDAQKLANSLKNLIYNADSRGR